MKTIKFTMVTEVIKTGRRFLEKEVYIVKDEETAKGKATSIINNFNATLRPGESPRKLIGVVNVKETKEMELMGAKMDSKLSHLWEKQNLVTNKDGSDTLKCATCGIVAKRVGTPRKDNCKRKTVY